MRKKILALVACLSVLSGCLAPTDCVSAHLVGPTLDHILDDHLAFLDGTKDPASIDPVEAEIIRGDVEVIRAAFVTARQLKP